MKIKKMWFASSFASARLLLLGSRINGVVTAVRTATALYWEAPVAFVENSDVLYVDRNKKRAASLLQSIGFQMPIHWQRVGSIGNIHYVGKGVNIQGENFKNVATYGDVENRRYSVSREADIDSNLLLQLNEWMEKGGKLPTEGYFTICKKTPAVLREHGALHLPIIMNESVLIKATGGKHSIALDDIAKLPYQLEHPVLLFRGSVDNSFVVLTDIQDKFGDDVIVAIHLKKWQNRLQVNRIASIYGKENIENYVKENVKNGNLPETDKNKAPIWFTSRGLQLPKLVQTLIGALDSDILLNSNEKINRKNSVSRKKIVDGEGLSEKQQEGALRTFDKIMREKDRDFDL